LGDSYNYGIYINILSSDCSRYRVHGGQSFLKHNKRINMY